MIYTFLGKALTATSERNVCWDLRTEDALIVMSVMYQYGSNPSYQCTLTLKDWDVRFHTHDPDGQTCLDKLSKEVDAFIETIKKYGTRQ